MLYVSTVTSHAPSWSSESVHRSSSQTIVSIDRRSCDISCLPVNDPATFFFARVFTRNIFLDHVMFHVQCSTRQVFETGNQNCESCWICVYEIYVWNYTLWWFIYVNYDLHSMIWYSPTIKHSWNYRYCSNSFVYKVKRKGSCCNWTISQCSYDIFHQRRFNNLVWKHTIWQGNTTETFVFSLYRVCWLGNRMGDTPKGCIATLNDNVWQCKVIWAFFTRLSMQSFNYVKNDSTNRLQLIMTISVCELESF